MKNIIIPTDFSRNLRFAMDYAIRNFNSPETNFILVHVYRMPYSGALVSIDLDDLLRQEREQELIKELEATRLKFPGVQIRGHAIQGIFVDVITKMVANDPIDMIVMGTKGATGAKNVLLGSNAANVVKHVKVPVLLVPDEYRIAQLKTVLLSTDLKHVNGYESFEPIRQIVKDASAKLEILHLEDMDDVPVDEERETLLLDTIFMDLPHGFNIRSMIQTEVDILDYAHEINADLIAVVARTYGFFERLVHRSTSRKLSMLTDVPLLILREH